MKKNNFLRNVALMIVACLVVSVVFISCDEGGSSGKIGGSQSSIGEEGNTFTILGSVPGTSGFSAQVIDLEKGVSTTAVSINISNANYLSMAALLPEVEVTGNKATIYLQGRVTTDGIQQVFPEGNLTLVKYNAKVGDVYSLKVGGKTIRREVTVVSKEDVFSWNGMKIKTIHVKETGMGVPGVDYVEYVTNHRFGLVGIKIFFENGTSISAPIVGSVTN